MPFTTTQLAQAMHHNNLQTWADSDLENQAQYLANFQTHFNNVQNWITQNGGPNPFGWDDVTGLHHNNGNQVVLVGPIPLHTSRRDRLVNCRGLPFTLAFCA
ncbi:hypothetical protein, partial [Burkholderia ubonensis]|uniref:hypothetical protein n=1 Tax=Burkholderia ubonensis TaxID=101571 RepID=UPI000B2B50E4